MVFVSFPHHLYIAAGKCPGYVKVRTYGEMSDTGSKLHREVKDDYVLFCLWIKSNATHATQATQRKALACNARDERNDKNVRSKHEDTNDTQANGEKITRCGCLPLPPLCLWLKNMFVDVTTAFTQQQYLKQV